MESDGGFRAEEFGLEFDAERGKAARGRGDGGVPGRRLPDVAVERPTVIPGGRQEEKRTLSPHMLIADLARYEDEMTSESKT